VKDTRTELRELLRYLPDSRFQALWKDLCAKAELFKPDKWTRPRKTYVHPPGWKRRFRNLRRAIKDMKPADWGVLNALGLYRLAASHAVTARVSVADCKNASPEPRSASRVVFHRLVRP